MTTTFTPLTSPPVKLWPKTIAVGVLGVPFPIHFWIPSQAAADVMAAGKWGTS